MVKSEPANKRQKMIIFGVSTLVGPCMQNRERNHKGIQFQSFYFDDSVYRTFLNYIGLTGRL